MKKKNTVYISDKEINSLHKDRMYLIFAPSKENPEEFSVKLADTTELELNSDRHSRILYIVMGLMSMIDEDLDFLLDKGEEIMYNTLTEQRKKEFADSKNVVVFNPHDRVH
tara:strand:- start:367 stop:699 length:333 start_codon:yes stop_codon:yes gene_type:complete